MNNRENDPQVIAQFQRSPQQGNGIGATGDSDANPLSCGNKLPLANVLEKLLEHDEILHREIVRGLAFFFVMLSATKHPFHLP
jgi:hypothetical protein